MHNDNKNYPAIHMPIVKSLSCSYQLCSDSINAILAFARWEHTSVYEYAKITSVRIDGCDGEVITQLMIYGKPYICSLVVEQSRFMDSTRVSNCQK